MKRPANSWANYKALVKEADETLAEILNGKSLNSNLNGIIHSLVCEKGLSPARWILENKELIKWLNSIKSPTTDELAMLKNRVETSIKKLAKR